jgi:hypothetical protein
METHLDFKHDVIRKSHFTQIESVGDDGGAGRECRTGEYELKSSTEAGLGLQLAEGSEGEKDE